MYSVILHYETALVGARLRGCVFDYYSHYRVSSALDGQWRWITPTHQFTDVVRHQQWLQNFMSCCEERTETVEFECKLLRRILGPEKESNGRMEKITQLL